MLNLNTFGFPLLMLAFYVFLLVCLRVSVVKPRSIPNVDGVYLIRVVLYKNQTFTCSSTCTTRQTRPRVWNNTGRCQCPKRQAATAPVHCKPTNIRAQSIFALFPNQDNRKNVSLRTHSLDI